MNRLAQRFSRVCVSAGVLASMAGCVDSNSRVTVGETVRLPAMEASATIPDEYPQDSRSLTGLDRANWASSTFLVPVDGTHHRATYADPLFLTDSTRRQRGEFPSIESALDLDGSEFGSDAAADRFGEGFAVPARAFVDAISIPVRLIGEPQTWEYVSPRHNYERQPLVRSTLLPPPIQSPERPETSAGVVTPVVEATEAPLTDPR